MSMPMVVSLPHCISKQTTPRCATAVRADVRVALESLDIVRVSEAQDQSDALLHGRLRRTVLTSDQRYWN